MPDKKSPPDKRPRLKVLIDHKTLMKIDELAGRYGVDPDEVLRELVEIETSQRPEGVTVH